MSLTGIRSKSLSFHLSSLRVDFPNETARWLWNHLCMPRSLSTRMKHQSIIERKKRTAVIFKGSENETSSWILVSESYLPTTVPSVLDIEDYKIQFSRTLKEFNSSLSLQCYLFSSQPLGEETFFEVNKVKSFLKLSQILFGKKAKNSHVSQKFLLITQN